MERDSLPVDLANPADVRAKLPEAKAILERKVREARALSEQVELWRVLVDALIRQAGLEPGPEGIAEPEGGSSEVEGLLDLVVGVVDREVRKIRSRDVATILRREGHEVSNNSVSNALYYAAHKAKRINSAPGRGFYAPFAYREELIFDSTNGAASGDEGGQSLNQGAVQRSPGDGTGGQPPDDPW